MKDTLDHQTAVVRQPGSENRRQFQKRNVLFCVVYCELHSNLEFKIRNETNGYHVAIICHLCFQPHLSFVSNILS